MTGISFNGTMYIFSAFYGLISEANIINIHKYLIKKHKIKQYSGFLNGYLQQY